MKKTMEFFFEKAPPIELGSGAVLVPIFKKKNFQKVTEKMSRLLEGNRWYNCKEQKWCLDVAVAQKCDAFSCEICPLRGKPSYDYKFIY